MREPIALGYMLARLTDTIADSSGVAITNRLELLEVVHASLDHIDRQLSKVQLVQELVDHEGEKRLVGRCDEIFDWLHNCEPSVQRLVRGVLDTIIKGQTWDLEFFHETDTASAKVKVANEVELRDYIYHVAGCVGEFWTKVGYAKLGDRFADSNHHDELMISGRSLGEGLQLINILRDLHEDLPANRFYISDQPTQEEFDFWISVCREKLAAGHRYVKLINNRRVRFATALPLLLAESTADKLELAGFEHVLNEKVKVSRSEVLRQAIQAALLT